MFDMDISNEFNCEVLDNLDVVGEGDDLFCNDNTLRNYPSLNDASHLMNNMDMVDVIMRNN